MQTDLQLKIGLPLKTRFLTFISRQPLKKRIADGKFCRNHFALLFPEFPPIEKSVSFRLNL